MPRYWISCALVGLTAFSQVLDAEDSPRPDAGGTPGLVVLTAPSAGREASRERRFVTELGLGLDGFRLVVQTAPESTFAELSLAKQIQALEPILTREGATVAVWIEDGGAETVLLHLIALDTGRALARIIEVKDNPNAESELALAAAELLGEAYMFTPQRPAAVVEKVAVVEEAIVTATPEEEGISPRWGLAAFGAVGSGIVGSEGPSLQGGPGGGLELVVAQQLLLRLSVAADIGPREDSSSLGVMVFGVRPGLAAAYLWRFGSFALGPAIGAAGQWTRTEINLGEGPSYSFDRWNARFSLGPEIRLSLSSDIDLLLAADVGVWSDVEIDRRLSDDRIAYATPRLDWRAALGVSARIR